MSILERIRNRSGLLVGFIGLALVLFVVSDLLSSRYSLFGRTPTDVGEVKGEKISLKYFDARVEEIVNNYKANTKSENVDANTMDMLREQTWNQLVQDALMSEAYDKLGITVTSDEMFDMVQGSDPHPSIKSAPIFQNQQTGQFDPTLVIRYLKAMSEDAEGEGMRSWLAFETGLKKERLTQKYNGLVKGGLYINSLEAREAFMARNKSIDMKFAGLNYASIPDSSFTLNDEELKKYFDKNISKYKNKEASCKLEYVLFDIFPSKEDSDAVKRWADDQLEPFKNASNDSSYVTLNSEAPYDTTYKKRGQLPAAIEDSVFTAAKGTVFGPVFENGSYKLFKVSDVKEDSTYMMRASHILFKIENGDTAAAIKKAKEVLAEVKGGASFEQKASQYGSDGTSTRGGDLGWFVDGTMVPEFNAAVKKANKGDIFYVKTQFGPHIVKVTANKTRKTVRLATLERKIEAGNKTVQAVYAIASQFAANSRDAESFDKNAAAANITKRLAESVKESERSIPGLENSREIIRWAFTAKKGDVSEEVYECGGKFVVVVLKEIREKDKANFEDAKLRVAEDAKKDKKAELITEKLNKALAEAKDPVAVALKLGNVANDAPNQTFENPNIPYMGMEKEILGTAFGMKPNVLSAPLKGDNGVYVVMVTKVNNPAEVPKDLKNFRDELLAPLKSRGEYELLNALKEISDVVDNRHRFY